MSAHRELGMIIDVIHECAEGWHTFTSTQIPGLFVAAEQADLQEVYEEIPLVVAALAKADFGRSVTVTPVKTYSEYAASLPETHTPITHYQISDMAA